jgi:hypothetical protein
MKKAPDRANDQGACGQQDYPQNPPPFSTSSEKLSIIRRAEAGRVDYIAGYSDDQILRGQNPRYIRAFRVEAVDLSRRACTCFAQGQCPTCIYFIITVRAREARRGAT